MSSNTFVAAEEAIECPICMEAVDKRKNCIVTECGHCFHAKCMMTNVQCNGFGCPICRHAMVEEEVFEEEEEDEEEEEEEDDGEELHDYTLRGMRWLFQRSQGEELDDFEEDEEPDQEPFVPTSAMVTRCLLERGITMEQLVKCLLIDHGEYDSLGDEYYRISDDTYSQIRQVIVDLTEEEAMEQEEREREDERSNNQVEEGEREAELVLHGINYFDEQNAMEEEEDRKRLREAEHRNQERMREGANHERKAEEEIMLMAWNDGKAEEKAEERARRRAEEEAMAQEDDDRYLDMFDDIDEYDNWVDSDEFNWAWNHRYCEPGLMGIDI
jgi:hypothetical protein